MKEEIVIDGVVFRRVEEKTDTVLEKIQSLDGVWGAKSVPGYNYNEYIVKLGGLASIKVSIGGGEAIRMQFVDYDTSDFKQWEYFSEEELQTLEQIRAILHGEGV